MQQLLSAVDRALVGLAVAALLVMTGICVASVLGRYFLNMPIPDDLTMSEMLIVVLVFLPFGRVQSLREHVAVSLFTDRMPPVAQSLCGILGWAVGLAFFAVVSAATYSDFHAAFTVGAHYDGRLELPEWPARLAVFVGCFILFLRLAVDLALAVRDLVRS